MAETVKKFSGGGGGLEGVHARLQQENPGEQKLRLMGHIIESEGYDDRALADDLANGFSLIGEVPLSQVLPKKLVPATLYRQDLENNSKRSNGA